jgi:hypothetical protein
VLLARRVLVGVLEVGIVSIATVATICAVTRATKATATMYMIVWYMQPKQKLRDATKKRRCATA